MSARGDSSDDVQPGTSRTGDGSFTLGFVAGRRSRRPPHVAHRRGFRAATTHRRDLLGARPAGRDPFDPQLNIASPLLRQQLETDRRGALHGDEARYDVPWYRWYSRRGTRWTCGTTGLC